MTRPAKRPTKALPAIYVVVDEDDEFLDFDTRKFSRFKKYLREYVEYPGDRIVKYIPAPRRGKGAK